MRPSIAVTESELLLSGPPDRQTMSAPLRVAAVFVIAWGVLLLAILGLTLISR